PQSPPTVPDDDIQVDQRRERGDLVTGAYTQLRRRGHRTAGGQYIVDQHDAPRAALHLEHTRAILQVVRDIDHRGRQFALLAHERESLRALERERGAENEAARL